MNFAHVTLYVVS